MENLQLVLSVLGVIAIAAVLVHGIWSIRKQQPKPLRDGPTGRSQKEPGLNRDREGFDADGIGQVRVVKQGSETTEESAQDFAARVEPQPEKPAEPVMTASRKEPVLATDVGVDDEPAPAVQQASLFAEEELQPETDAQAVLDLDEQGPQEAEQPAAVKQQEEPLGDPVDVLVLHVCAKEGEELQGAELLPCMLTLNLKFGDMNIFHRHEDNAGTGKVLFSVANMVKPGTFDPDNMEQFATQGIVMFMTLPCHGDALRNFSIMLNSACQLADDLGAEVLDDRRQPWANETKQAYLERIRAVVQ